MNRLPIIGERVRVVRLLQGDAGYHVPAGSVGTVTEVETGIEDKFGMFGGKPQCRVVVKFDEAIEPLNDEEMQNCWSWYPECGPPLDGGGVLEEFWRDCVSMHIMHEGGAVI